MATQSQKNKLTSYLTSLENLLDYMKKEIELVRTVMNVDTEIENDDAVQMALTVRARMEEHLQEFKKDCTALQFDDFQKKYSLVK